MKNMFSRKQLGIPYGLFLVLFVAAPLLVLVYYAFTDGSGKFSITNLLNFFTDPNTLGTLCYSFVLAIVTTLVCLLIAYPVAYILAHSKIKRKAVILLLFVMPMWINFTLRITALKEILSLIEGNLAFYPFFPHTDFLSVFNLHSGYGTFSIHRYNARFYQPVRLSS